MTKIAAGLILLLGGAAGGGRTLLAAEPQKDLEQVRRQLSQLRQDIEAYQNQEDSLQKDMTTIQSRKGEAGRKLSRIHRALKRAERQRDVLEGKLSILGRTSALWKRELSSDLRNYWMVERAQNDFYDLQALREQVLRRSALLRKARFLGDLDATGQKTARASEKTQDEARLLLSQSLAARQQEELRQREYAAKAAVMSQTEEKLQAALQKARELEETEKALNKLMGELGARRRAPKGPAVLPLAGHSLPWPAPGRVIREFGRFRNPQIGTWQVSRGITLETARDAFVSAVKDGKVIFSGPFRSYGRILIVDQGSNFFTIYGNLGRVLKQKGDAVAAGEEIATAGAAPDSGAGKIYLEFRFGTEALDPLLWLRK